MAVFGGQYRVAADEDGLDEDAFAVPTLFIGADDATVQFANHFAIQHHEGEFVLTVSQLIPPLLLGTDEEKREQLRELSYVPIKVIGRFGFTRGRLQSLIEALQTNLARFDESEEAKP